MSDAPAKKPFWLSASRIDTFTTCSALYAAKYLAKLPDKGNDGSSRGSVCHEVLECLLKPRHEKHLHAALSDDSCRNVAPLWRLIRRLAARYRVNDETNLDMIDGFILVALKQDFKGPRGTIKIEGEKEFEVQIDRTHEDGPRYNVRGAIDKTFHVKDRKGARLQVVDYKGSKKRFDGEKETDNVQSKMYQLALRHLYPEITRREFEFLFMKFSKTPIQKQPSFTDEELDAFEWRLHYLQQAMEAFSWDDALDHPAALNPDNAWLCGREGIKKDGTPMWICPARNPLDYWVLKEGDDIVMSAFTEKELVAKEGQQIEKTRYPGCALYWNPNGKRRSNQ